MLKPFLTTKFALPTIAAIGILLAVAIVKLQPAMAHNPQLAIAKKVTVITAKPDSLRPSIVGFGTVEPDISLQTKAEVSGRITYINPKLKKGSIVAADTLLLSIDDKDYQLALRQAQADLLANQSSLQQMELTIKNTELDYQLAKQKLKVAQSEYQRKAQLRKQGSVSQSELDAQKQNVLQLEQENQSLKGKLATLPADVEVIKAKIAISEAKVAQAQRDIQRTQVKLGFNGRIAQVAVEQGQFVTLGATLFEASGYDKMLINAQFSVSDFRRLLTTVDKSHFDIQHLLAGDEANDLLTQAGLTARITNPMADGLSWQATVERISDNLDPQSRTVGVIVSVSHNFDNLDPQSNPPLVKGMYMQVELAGVAREYTVIPRSALHQNELYIVSKNNTLRRLSIRPNFVMGDFALFDSRLKTPLDLIVSDVFPAVDGMAVEAVGNSPLLGDITQFVRDNQ